MFVQRFENGEAASMAVSSFRSIWEPHVDRREPLHHYWHVTAGDAGEADVYADLGDADFDSLTLARFSAGQVLDLLVEFIGVADAVVLPPGCPTLLAVEEQRRHLPDELRPDAVVVRSGADVQRVLRVMRSA